MLHVDDLSDQIDLAFGKILTSAHDFHREGSDWTFDKILGYDLCIASYQPLTGNGYIELPDRLKAKRAIINVKNDDDKCFVYSAIAGIDRRTHSHPNKASNYFDIVETLNLSGLVFPLPLSQISTFEKQNNISVNVFGYQNEVFPLRITKERGLLHVNLLLITEGNNSHYCLIKSLSRLLSQHIKHNGKSYYCNYCLHSFTSEELLQNHISLCDPHEVQKPTLPSEDDKVLFFKNYAYQLKSPFVIYCDFETFPEKVSTILPNESRSFSVRVQKHEPCSFCYLVVSIDPKHNRKPVIYRGPDAVGVLLDQLKKEAEWIENVKSVIQPVTMQQIDQEKLMQQTPCYKLFVTESWVQINALTTVI